MQIYLVGGAVRDELLNYPTSEHDYVVVGATPEEMLEQGFMPVGKDFPVFLHPKTKEEYALARTERKTGRGYQGFSFNADPSITLEEDLGRRDLSINAIAKSENGEYIDPYNGKDDIQNKCLRHINDAFREDPVRILRTARFYARYHHLGFEVAEDTIDLMRSMVNDGEADFLVPERVWKELSRAMSERSPDMFFALLERCGALAVVAPELLPLLSKNNASQTSTAFSALKAACSISDSAKVRLAAFVHSLDLPTANKLIKRLKPPNDFKTLVQLVVQNINDIRNSKKKTAPDVFNVIEKCDALRQEERFFDAITVAKAIDESVSASDNYLHLEESLNAVKTISAKSVQDKNLSGKALGDAIKQKRIEAIASIINN